MQQWLQVSEKLKAITCRRTHWCKAVQGAIAAVDAIAGQVRRFR